MQKLSGFFPKQEALQQTLNINCRAKIMSNIQIQNGSKQWKLKT